MVDSKTSSFFSGLTVTLKNVRVGKEQSDILLATDFNVFDYIRPVENTLSDIVADLLNPVGMHGQGDAFLVAFLRHLNSPILKDLQASGTRAAKVTRESTTNRIPRSTRRIDITVELGGLGVGIENKPWAPDLPDQVADYVNQLERTYQGRFHFVYLSPNGTPPKSLAKEKVEDLVSCGKLSIWAYSRGLRDWLRECERSCEADKVRWFLRDFQSYVANEFSAPEPEGES